MFQWNEESVATASKMWNDGASPTEIAKALRCEDAEVRAKLRTLDLERATRPAPPVPPDA